MAISTAKFADPFGEISQQYDQFRPRYPVSFFAQLRAEANRLGLAPNRILDAGCGSGISTRQLAEAFGDDTEIIGLDPSPEMLQVARAHGTPKSRVSYLQGFAEAIPLSIGSCSIVTACQAVQWFDRPRFYVNAHRALCSRGLLAIIQNNRAHEFSPFLAAYEHLLEKVSPGYTRNYRDIDFECEVPATHRFAWYMSMSCRWQREITSSEFLQFTLTSSKVMLAVRAIGLSEWGRQLEALWRQYHGSASHGAILYDSQMFVFRHVAQAIQIRSSRELRLTRQSLTSARQH
jgi:ubiquinone/menaquinone biosynthesis C-methylase UbiE